MKADSVRYYIGTGFPFITGVDRILKSPFVFTKKEGGHNY